MMEAKLIYLQVDIFNAQTDINLVRTPAAALSDIRLAFAEHHADI